MNQTKQIEEEDILGYKIDQAKLARDRQIVKEFRSEFNYEKGLGSLIEMEVWLLKKIEEVRHEVIEEMSKGIKWSNKNINKSHE